ncbi:MAG TPA: extracellular solute-binding protein [Clostridia bacterium]
MRGIRKKFIAACMILITIGTLASCKSTERFQPVIIDKTNKSSPKVKLRFISSWGGEDPKAATLQELLDKFSNLNSGIEITNESMSGEDFLQKLKVDFASGYNQDVFGLWPGLEIRELVKAGKVADLTDVLESDREWKESFDNDGWSYTTYGGRVYGLPLEKIYECLFINKDLFEKYKVKVPEDFDEFKTAVKIFRQNKIVPVAYNSSPEGSYIYQNIVERLGGKYGVENPYTKDGVNSCYIEAMKYMKELFQMQAFPENYYEINNRERNNLFKSKSAAMIVQGSWFMGDLERIYSAVEMIPFPYIKGGKSDRNSLIYGFGCGTFYMSTSAWNDPDKREASIKLLKYLTSKDSATSLVQRTAMLSNVYTGNAENYNGYLKRSENYILENAGELVGPPDSFVDRGTWERLTDSYFPRFLEGKITAEKAWNDAAAPEKRGQLQ